MKRSEMITKLRDYFFGEDVRPENFCGFSNKFIEDFSDSILTFLENQGMRPPLPQPVKIIVEKDEPLGIQNTDTWEKEDETQ
jgi:hypothetical protein